MVVDPYIGGLTAEQCAETPKRLDRVRAAQGLEPLPAEHAIGGVDARVECHWTGLEKALLARPNGRDGERVGGGRRLSLHNILWPSSWVLGQTEGRASVVSLLSDDLFVAAQRLSLCGGGPTTLS